MPWGDGWWVDMELGRGVQLEPWMRGPQAAAKEWSETQVCMQRERGDGTLEKAIPEGLSGGEVITGWPRGRNRVSQGKDACVKC